MHSRPIGSAPPPFYWKVPVPEKDYMSENYRRIRQIANQSQKKRSEPLKAAFIPGVTKNEKYAHVSSRVGEFLKTKKGSDAGTNVSTASTNQRAQPQRPAGTNQPINRRLSKSSTDLRQNNTSQSISGLKNSVPPPNASAQIRRRRGSQESFHPSQESVYNWRFRDDVNPPGASFSNGVNNSNIAAKYCHRVEYLPYDGICAEENFVVDDGPPENARSVSSCRTSRGCNTEETRILEDPVKYLELDKPVDNSGDSVKDTRGELLSKSQLGPKPKTRSVHTMPSQENFGRKGESAQWFKANNSAAESKSFILDSMKNGGRQRSEPGRLKTSASATSINGIKSQINSTSGGGEFPHGLGTVPKYLKQRQEEWKVQEKERREAEMNANVPQGYVLLSENERMEHLKTFKRNYDTLINDLNRIPIRIDTIRVREHKIQLEQQLTRLEEAMKTFSRPRVWIKVDD